MKSWPRAKCCLKFEKQQASGCRRASMIFAFGRIRWMNGHEQPVVRQLVDEERLVGPPLHPRALQIFLAELLALVAAKLQHCRGIRPRLVHERRDVGKLGRAFDLAVAARICSISVDPARGRPTMKIGSGAVAPALALRERLRREARDAPVDRARELCRIVRPAFQPERIGLARNERRPRRSGRHRASPCRARNRGGSGPRPSGPATSAPSPSPRRRLRRT